MSLDREQWQKIFAERSWEEILFALDRDCRRDRGGKLVVGSSCEKCDREGVIVLRPNGTFICRACRAYTGDKIDYIINEAAYNYSYDGVPPDDILLQEVAERLPAVELKSQLRLPFRRKLFWRKHLIPMRLKLSF